MLTAKRWFRFFVMVVLFYGCSPSKPAVTLPPTPDLLEVSLDPALDWLKPDFAFCQQSLGDKTLSIQETQPARNGAVDFSWGEKSGQANLVFQIGQDEPVLIINFKNPVLQIPFNSIDFIFTGAISAWKDIDPSAAALGDIHLWNFSDASHLQLIFNNWFNISPNHTASVALAPDMDAMLSAIAADPSAIGWLPKRWLNEKVKPPTILGLPQDKKPLPILLYLNQNPDAATSAWIHCVQEKIQKTTQ